MINLHKDQIVFILFGVFLSTPTTFSLVQPVKQQTVCRWAGAGRLRFVGLGRKESDKVGCRK